MNIQHLIEDEQTNLEQITDRGEAPRFLRALITVSDLATSANFGGANINRDLSYIFNLIRYFQVAAEINAYNQGKGSDL